MLGEQKTDSSPKSIVSKASRPKDVKKITRVPKRVQLNKSGQQVKSKSAPSPARQKFLVKVIIFFSVLLVILLLKNFGIFESAPSNPGTIIDPIPVTNASSNPEGQLAINWTQPPIYPENLRDPMEVTDQFIEETVVIEHPDLEVSGTSTVEGGNYMVTIGNNPLPFRVDSVINDSKGREVKIIDIKLNQVVFEMGSVLWMYDLRSKEWNQNNSEDILGD